MKGHSEDSEHEHLAQRLTFTTPEKRFADWRAHHEDYARKLFDSAPKLGQTTNNIVLVMPFFE